MLLPGTFGGFEAWNTIHGIVSIKVIGDGGYT